MGRKIERNKPLSQTRGKDPTFLILDRPGLGADALIPASSQPASSQPHPRKLQKVKFRVFAFPSRENMSDVVNRVQGEG
jgi:hypothetical protein